MNKRKFNDLDVTSECINLENFKFLELPSELISEILYLVWSPNSNLAILCKKIKNVMYSTYFIKRILNFLGEPKYFPHWSAKFVHEFFKKLDLLDKLRFMYKRYKDNIIIRLCALGGHSDVKYLLGDSENSELLVWDKHKNLTNVTFLFPHPNYYMDESLNRNLWKQLENCENFNTKTLLMGIIIYLQNHIIKRDYIGFNNDDIANIKKIANKFTNFAVSSSRVNINLSCFKQNKNTLSREEINILISIMMIYHRQNNLLPSRINYINRKLKIVRPNRTELIKILNDNPKIMLLDILNTKMININEITTLNWEQLKIILNNNIYSDNFFYEIIKHPAYNFEDPYYFNFFADDIHIISQFKSALTIYTGPIQYIQNLLKTCDKYHAEIILDYKDKIFRSEEYKEDTIKFLLQNINNKSNREIEFKDFKDILKRL